MDNLYTLFTTHFVHIFWALAFVVWIYSLYFDFFKIKKRHQYMSDSQLLERFMYAKRKGLIK